MKETFRLLLAFSLPLGIILFLNFKSVFEPLSIVGLLLFIILSKKEELVLIAASLGIGYITEAVGIGLHNSFELGWYYPPLDFVPFWVLISWVYNAWSSNILSEKYLKTFIRNRQWFYAVLGLFFVISTIIHPAENLVLSALPIIGLVIVYWKRLYEPRMEFFGLIISLLNVMAEHLAFLNGVWLYDLGISLPTISFIWLIYSPLIITLSNFILRKLKIES